MTHNVEPAADYDAPRRYEHPRRGALNAGRVEDMRRAWSLGVCYITPDGWCATHSTSEGPVYCERDDLTESIQRGLEQVGRGETRRRDDYTRVTPPGEHVCTDECNTELGHYYGSVTPPDKG